MFKFNNIKGDATVTVSLGKNKVDFPIETIMNRRLKDGVIDELVFILLNEYIDTKTDEFKENLFKAYTMASNGMNDESVSLSIDNPPMELLHDVLDLLDYEEIREFILNNKRVVIPKALPEVFDENSVIDTHSTRAQTYIKTDYISFIALITILKAAMPILGAYATAKESVIANSVYKEMLLLRFFVRHPLYRTTPFVKLRESLTILVERLYSNEEQTALRIVDKKIDRDNIPNYVIGVVLVQKILFSNELTDNDVKNTVTSVYSFASDKVSIKAAGANKHALKYYNNGNSTDSNGDEEGVLESYRIASDLSIGDMVKFKHAFKNPYRLLQQLKVPTTNSEVDKLIGELSKLKTLQFTDESVYITSWVFKDILDPRSLEYLEIDELINALAVAHLYLAHNNHKELAIIITTYKVKSDSFKLSFNVRGKLDETLRAELAVIFPYNEVRRKGANRISWSPIELIIDETAIALSGTKLMSSISTSRMNALAGTTSLELTIPKEFKNLLAKYIIDINTTKEEVA